MTGLPLSRRLSENNIVATSSDDATTWTPVVRIPIDDTTSTVDHSVPGVVVDRTTQGSTAKLVLAYYFYANVRCSTTTRRLEVGDVSSDDGGATWSSAQTLRAQPMPARLAGPHQPRIDGRRLHLDVDRGRDGIPVLAVPRAPENGYDETINTVQGGLPIGNGPVSRPFHGRIGP